MVALYWDVLTPVLPPNDPELVKLDEATWEVVCWVLTAVPDCGALVGLL